ncbi:MAG: 30S ribosomal protein S1 [Legionellales bacterium]|nr:30S ribosomal protein S1 [Legionellales bacterium]
MSENFAELFEKTQFDNLFRQGDIIKASVISIDRDYVILDAGLKSEGLIPINEFCNSEGQVEVSIGDEIDVVLDDIEDGFGGNVLSREKAKKQAAWLELTEKYKSGETVSGLVTGRVKGGFTVEVSQVKAFLPGSLVDVRPVKDPKFIEGKQVEFKIIKMDAKRNNIVVSRKALLESENAEERAALLESLAEGQVVRGIVKNLTDYGAFIDLGGIDGLLHITDISWKRISHPGKVLNIGDEITVKILKFDKEKTRFSLGIKQLGEDPWLDLVNKYPVGTKLVGKVTNITDYGCFVEIDKYGVEGLVHMTEMDWTNKNVHPSKVVSLGDEVEVQVLEIDNDRRRISLGMKQCISNPWVDYANRHNIGENIKGVIKSITDFGIFVGLEGSIDGLIHLSDLSYDDDGENAVKEYSKNQEIEAVILSIDPERERISLGIKQLTADVFLEYLDANPRGTIVNTKVIEVNKKDVKLELIEGVLGEIKARDLSAEENVDDARMKVKVGDNLEAKIISADKKAKVVYLSVKAKDVEEEAEAIKNYQQSANTSTTKLGDLFKEQMSNDEKE